MTTFKETNWLVKVSVIILYLTVDQQGCQMSDLKDRVKVLEDKTNQKHIDSVNRINYYHYQHDSIKRALNH